MKRKLRAETALEKENSGKKQTLQNSPPNSTCAEFVLEQLLGGKTATQCAPSVEMWCATSLVVVCASHSNLPTDRTTRRQRWPDFALNRVCEFDPEWMSMDIAPTAHGFVASEVTLNEHIPHCSDVSYQRKMLQLRGRQPSRDNAQKGRPARVFLQIAAQHDFAIKPELPSRTRSNPRRGCRFWDSCRALRRRARARCTSRLLCLCNTQDIRQLVGQVQRVGTSKVTARLMDG